MNQGNKSHNQPVHAASVGKRMLQGAGIAFLFILAFILSSDELDPNWGKFWMLKPLIIVPLAGALGGLFHYNIDHLRCQGGSREAFAYVLSLLVYILVVWLGTVLGLNGTMWD